MEVVRAFNNELSSLYEARPPISKAKMTQITKCAIKGIKFYKHIVQSVEKFVQKCRPEYKVPGLYVVDSIVRQSRHQFGADKDVFAPRFTKNIMLTFQNLFKCAEEDRPKIVRVLNLWQKNTVFASDVIQPLLDMANPNNSVGLQHSVSGENVTQSSKHKSHDVSSWKGWSHSQMNDEPLQDAHQYHEISLGNLEKHTRAESSLHSREDMATHLSQSNNQLHMNKTLDTKPTDEGTVKFNKKLLDFDYGDEEDEEDFKREDGQLSNEPNALALSMAQNLLSNPELLRQLQQMQQTIQQNEALKSELAMKSDEPPMPDDSDHRYSPMLESPPASNAVPQHQEVQFPIYNSSGCISYPPLPPLPGLEKHLLDVSSLHQPALPQEPRLLPESHDEDERMMYSMPGEPPLPPRDLDERSLLGAPADDRPTNTSLPFPEIPANLIQFQFDSNAIPFPSQPPLPLMDPIPVDSGGFPMNILPPEPMALPTGHIDEDDRMMYSMPGEPPLPPHDLDERSLMISNEERVKKNGSRSRSGSRSRIRSNRRSRSKSPRNKKSRSRSRSRSRRNRSRSRERLKEKEREREREREREHERKRKGIPPKKKNSLSVCSTTLWLGHVPKTVSEVELTDTFGEFGIISSIDMIPPRGCAYICMGRRQDAYRCITKLKNLKLQGSTIKMAWAPGKGVKGKEYKEFWEVNLGVSYIPFEKLTDNLDDLDLLEEGGFIDEESMPEHLREMRQKQENQKTQVEMNKVLEGNNIPLMKDAILHQPPPMMPPPSSMGMPMMLPQLMQQQFGVHIPGLMPPHSMVMPVPMGVPPPNPMMMVQPPSQAVLGGQPLPVGGSVPPMPHLPMNIPPTPVSTSGVGGHNVTSSTDTMAISPIVTTSMSLSNSGDATPTEEDGTRVSTPGPASVSQSVTSTLPASSMQSSVSVSSTSTVAQFNPMLGLHNGGRTLISVPPPVSATGAPIPFPPPNVNFGFPPPPIRPPGQLGGSPSFPWMQKPGGPGFLNFHDAEGRFGGPQNARPGPPPPPVPQQAYNALLPPFPEMPSTAKPPSNPAGASEDKNSGKDNDLKPPSPDFRTSEQDDGHGNRNSMKEFHPQQHERMKMRGHLEDPDMDTEDGSQDLFHGENLDFPPDDYPRMPQNPRFSGDFHRGRGPVEMPWRHGPPPGGMSNPRFQRNMHPGSPFPHRMSGPRGMPPRTEMDFHHSQGPRGPRMPMGGPHNRRGGGPNNNSMMLTPPRHPGGRERFPGRRGDFYDPPYDRDPDRRYRDREDWGRGRDRRDMRDENEDWGPREEDWERQQFSGRDRERKRSDDMDYSEGQFGRDSRFGDREQASKRPRPSPTKPQGRQDYNEDMFRQPPYSRDKDRKPRLPRDGHPSGSREPGQDEPGSKDFANRQPGDSESEHGKELLGGSKLPEVENVPGKLTETNDSQSSEEASARNAERSNREKKRSRWGRSVSEEKEFQQQRINEIEMKFNSYVLVHSAQTSENNVNGNTNVEESGGTQCNTSTVKTTTDTVSENVPVSGNNICSDEIVKIATNAKASEDKKFDANVSMDCKETIGMVCNETVGTVCKETIGTVCKETVGMECKETVSMECKETVIADHKEIVSVDCSKSVPVEHKIAPEPTFAAEQKCNIFEKSAGTEIPKLESDSYISEKETPSQIPEPKDSDVVAPVAEES